MLPLPIDAIVGEAVELSRRHRALVLTAPPGAGKSTRIPPALGHAVNGAVYLLQPRRIAAKTLARRIADEQGWTLGREVGYRVRFERVGHRDTRLWVMTEGSLTRQFHDDPYLDGVGAVILDEFHERSIHSDLALAWLRELQRTVREDLIVAVMSATMDAAPVAAFLGDAPVMASPGRPHPVAVTYDPATADERLDARVARAVGRALDDPASGDVLVFLPGTGEIRGCLAALDGRVDAEVLPLHGSLPPEEQDRALSPGVGRRVILATNVAETSLTIPGVRTVIDAGLARVARFDADRGLDGLHLEPISRSSAEQRAGRAGRTAPGRCMRLWSRLEDARRADADDAEIARVDLAPVALSLKRWQGADIRAFPWYEAPAPDRLAAAEDLLAMLGATAAPYAPLTALGQRLAALPTHPRLGRLLIDAEAAGEPRLGATLAALLGERDLRLPRPGPRRDAPIADPGSCDALDRLALFDQAERARFSPALRDRGIDPIAAREVGRVRDELLQALPRSGVRGLGSGVDAAQATGTSDGIVGHGTGVGQTPDPGRQIPDRGHALARLLLAAYPDRVAKRAVPDANRGAMVGGVAVEIDRGSGLATRSGAPRPPLFLAYDVQGLSGRRVLGRTTLVRQGAELDEALIEAVHPGSIRGRDQLTWNDQAQRVDAQVGWFHRDLCIRVARDGQPEAAAVSAFLAERLRADAARLIAADEEAASWLMRLAWLRAACPDLALPAVDEADIAAMIDGLCAGCRSRDEVQAKPKLPWLQARLSHDQRRLIEDFAPSHLVVPTGNRIRVDYADASADKPPVLAVRLQELFGLGATPRLAGGRVPLLLHLLGPNYRPEQITRDLAGFWSSTYPQVRKDLRGRYPKHSWPDDPLTAPPVAKGRPRR